MENVSLEDESLRAKKKRDRAKNKGAKIQKEEERASERRLEKGGG